MLKKNLSVLLAVVIMMGVISAFPSIAFAKEIEIADEGKNIELVETGATKTQSEAVDWANGTVGSWIGSGQCVALIEAYCRYLGLSVSGGNGNACDYTGARNISDSSRINNYSGFVPQPGDICVWGSYACMNSGYQTDYYGHIGIVISADASNMVTVECNLDSPYNGGICKKVTRNRPTSYVSCFIRPNFKNTDPDPTPDFTPVDLGTDFYGSIVNLAVNKPIKVSGGNVVCGIRNGSDEQKWRFERQGDLSYKIINVANGECLDDDNYGNTDNTNIKTCGSNDTDAQRWFFRNNGSGYSLVPKCAQNLAMDLVDGNSTEGNNIAAWTYVENNGNQIYGIDHQPSFTPVDIGTNFYGSIVNLAANKPIKVSNNNVVMGIRNGSDEQKWKFERMDDRMYKITNVATGKCLDDDNYGTTDDTNIKVIGSNNEPAQRWYFRKNGSGYSLVPRCAQNLAMDMVGGNSSEGNNVAAWTFVENNGNQIFGIDKQPSFTPQDLGDRFTVNIIHSSSGSVVTENSEKNVVIQKFNGSDSQKWLFERMDDRMYKITNVASGRVLDIDNGGTTDDTNIHTWASLDNLHQRWYLWKNGTGYSLVPKCSLNLSMDLVGGKTEDGSNLAAWTSVSGNVNQIYTLELKAAEPTTPTEQPTTPTEPPTPTEQPTTPTEPTIPTEPKTIILGDVDGDGVVTILDATAIQRHLASIPTASYNEKAADADGDGSVTILDATAIQRHLAQLLTNENIGKPIA